MIEIKHRVTNAVLWSSNACSMRAAVIEAVSKRADLRGAYLRGADLRGADLRGADLTGADLRGAYLRGDKAKQVIATVVRSDGYSFIALALQSGGYKIHAGCRWFTADEYETHIKSEYDGTDKAVETREILAYIAARASHFDLTPEAVEKVA